MALPHHVPLAVAYRNNHPECVFNGSVAVVDIHGKLLAYAGDPGFSVFSRSALKPFQALPFLVDQGPQHFKFTTQETALLGASHSGEAIHTDTVEQILLKSQSTEQDLACGCHTPMIYDAEHLPPPGLKFNQTHHNCSGKHSGFLAYCCMHHHDKKTYLEPTHPLQTRIKEMVADVCDMSASDLWTGVDGCSAPNLGMPLSRLALMWARLGAAQAPQKSKYNEGLKTIRDAMLAHPILHSGTGRAELAINQSGPWVVKSGADGIHAIGVPEHGLGIAVKISDGNMNAVVAVTVEVLNQLGLVQADDAQLPLSKFRNPVIKNWRGHHAGQLKAIVSLVRP